MDLGNMRRLGVRGLAVHCLNEDCRHDAVFSADDYPDEVELPSFPVEHDVWRVRRQTC
jgi:hypothetical protein